MPLCSGMQVKFIYLLKITIVDKAIFREINRQMYVTFKIYFTAVLQTSWTKTMSVAQVKLDSTQGV